MDVKSGNFRFRLGSVQLLFLIIFLLPFGDANATRSISNRIVSDCAPAMTMPDASLCSTCHTSNSPSRSDLNSNANQPSTFFCPATSTGTGTGAGTGTGTGSAGGSAGGAMGSGMTGMRGSRGMSGMRGMGSGYRRHHHDDDDDDDDDDDGDDDDDRDDDD